MIKASKTDLLPHQFLFLPPLLPTILPTMGTRFNRQPIYRAMAPFLLTPMSAIALGLGAGHDAAIAQSQPIPIITPADLEDLNETLNIEVDAVDLDSSPLPSDTEDLGLEIESPNGDDLDSDNIPRVDDLESDDIPTETLNDLNPIDVQGEDNSGININDLQVDDLNEALDEDIIPPIRDILNNGIELEIEPPTSVPNRPPITPPPPNPAVPGKRSQFGGVTIFEDVVLTPNAMANPTTIRGISGGPLTASQVAGRAETVTGICTGFVDREPDHQMELTAFFDYLNLQVESSDDTVLVVRGPGGSWCNDDVQGFNPGLAGEWFSGTYDIWIGSYNANTYYPYVIRLTNIQPSN